MRRLSSFQRALLVLMTLMSIQVSAAEKEAELDWSRLLQLSTPVSGVVKQVDVIPGQQVKAGQRLIRLDDRGFRAEVKRAEGVLKRATETYAEAKREMDRADELFDRTAISVHDRELVRIDFSKADASLREAEAELTRARLELEYSVVIAPEAALVVDVSAFPGQTVVNRLQVTPLLALTPLSAMIARTHVSADELKTLANGDQVDVRIADHVVKGRISRMGLEPVSDRQPPLYALEVSFDPAGKLYRKGQQATVILP